MTFMTSRAIHAHVSLELQIKTQVASMGVQSSIIDERRPFPSLSLDMKIQMN